MNPSHLARFLGRAFAGFLALFRGWLLWLYARLASAVQSCLIRILKYGPMPRHIAFIMDGNRRFATGRGLSQKKEGHLFGYAKLEQTLEWCVDLGIQCVSVYAFSIDNYKRPLDEVDFLMDLAARKFDELSRESQLVSENGISIRVIGALDLLRSDVKQSALQAMKDTENNTNYCLSIACPYTSREEMTSSLNQLCEMQAQGRARSLSREALTALYESNLYSNQQPAFPPPSILVRTSGEHRLSDFFLWQSTTHGCQVYFERRLWPEFSFWNLFMICLSFQYQRARG